MLQIDRRASLRKEKSQKFGEKVLQQFLEQTVVVDLVLYGHFAKLTSDSPGSIFPLLMIRSGMWLAPNL